MTVDVLLTQPDVADQLKIPLGTLRYWRHIGQGPASFRLGRSVRYRQSAVDAYLAEQETAEAERLS